MDIRPNLTELALPDKIFESDDDDEGRPSDTGSFMGIKVESRPVEKNFISLVTNDQPLPMENFLGKLPAVNFELPTAMGIDDGFEVEPASWVSDHTYGKKLPDNGEGISGGTGLPFKNEQLNQPPQTSSMVIKKEPEYIALSGCGQSAFPSGFAVSSKLAAIVPERAKRFRSSDMTPEDCCRRREERKRKNRESAQNSRDKRKAKEKNDAYTIECLSVENAILKARIDEAGKLYFGHIDGFKKKLEEYDTSLDYLKRSLQESHEQTDDLKRTLLELEDVIGGLRDKLQNRDNTIAELKELLRKHDIEPHRSEENADSNAP
ncbi:hypothetical protein [Endozoicomonas lisbonensis]|uniref:BZIP domain-containing protein n=1 Tax=Endozoicomonas lisbonensis TaxID=3120522 RepID=A0ABV2SHI2_9GAMM